MMLQKQRMPVWLRLYDISNGRAAAWSQLILGRRIEAVWHTGVQVFGLEYFYAGGIEVMTSSSVEDTYDMEIVEEQLLGYTTQTREAFQSYLRSISDCFTPDTYDLCRWNCNHFSDACVRFLLNGSGIPDSILHLPDTVRSTFIGALILAFVERLNRNKRNYVQSPKSDETTQVILPVWAPDPPPRKIIKQLENSAKQTTLRRATVSGTKSSFAF